MEVQPEEHAVVQPGNDKGLDKKLCSMLCQKGPISTVSRQYPLVFVELYSYIANEATSKEKCFLQN